MAAAAAAAASVAVVTDPVAPVGAETTSFGAKGEGLEV
jgi:hypothetical protein